MKDESLLEEIGESLLEEARGMANVTVRADADCFLLCDGEYLDIQLEAGKLTKVQVPTGHHLLEFLYTEDPDIKVEKNVDFPKAGGSYLVIIKDLKAAVDVAEEAKRKAEEKTKRKAAEEAKRKAEEKAKRKEEEKKREMLEKNFCFSANISKKMIDKEIRPAADLGNANAQFVLGKCYYLGQGVQQNYAEAVKWYKMAAEQGNHWAQSNLASCYKDAKGVRYNIKLAKKWYGLAAEQGNEEANKILQKWA